MQTGALGVLPSWCSGQAVMVCPSPPRSAAGGGSLTSPEARHGQCRGSPGYRQVQIYPRSQRSAEWIVWMRRVIETVARHTQPQTGAHCHIFQKRNVIIGNYNLPGLSVKKGGGAAGTVCPPSASPSSPNTAPTATAPAATWPMGPSHAPQILDLSNEAFWLPRYGVDPVGPRAPHEATRVAKCAKSAAASL